MKKQLLNIMEYAFNALEVAYTLLVPIGLVVLTIHYFINN